MCCIPLACLVVVKSPLNTAIRGKKRCGMAVIVPLRKPYMYVEVTVVVASK